MSVGQRVERMLSETAVDGHPTWRYWGNTLWRWRDGYWAIVGDPEVYMARYLYQADRMNFKPYEANQGTLMLKALTGDPDREGSNPPFWWSGDEPSDWIVFANGMVPVEEALTGGPLTMRPHTPRLFNTARMPWSYDPGAECSQWLEWIEEALPDEDMRLCLQEWCGHLLVPDIRRQKALFCVGNGASGKSTCAELMMRLVGEENSSALAMDLLFKASGFMTGETAGKLVNVCEELRRFPPQLQNALKAYTGGTKTTSDRKHTKALTFKPTARIVVVTNTAILGTDSSDGLWRRILLLPFPRLIPVNLNLWDTFLGELTGIGQWALGGYARLQKQVLFTEPEMGVRLLNAHKREQVPYTVFLDQCVERADDHYVPTEDLRLAFQRWAADEGVEGSFNPQKCHRDIRTKYPSSVQVQRAGSRGVVGIRITKPALRVRQPDQDQEDENQEQEVA